MSSSPSRLRALPVLAATLATAITLGLLQATPATASTDDRADVLGTPFADAPANKRVSGTTTTLTATATPRCDNAFRCELEVSGVTPSSGVLRPLRAGSQPWPSWVQPGEVLTVRFTSVAIARNGERAENFGAHPWVVRPGPTRTKLTAEVRSVDHAAKSAVIAGTATKGAEVSIGGHTTTADVTTGAWSITVTGLVVGANPITAIQRINGVEYDRVNLSVMVDPPALDPVTVTSPATVAPGVENRFTGKATPGATFRVLDASGNQITPGRHAVDENGEWEFATIVPAGATTFSFVIEQTAYGRTEPSELFTFAADTRG